MGPPIILSPPIQYKIHKYKNTHDIHISKRHIFIYISNQLLLLLQPNTLQYKYKYKYKCKYNLKYKYIYCIIRDKCVLQNILM